MTKRNPIPFEQIFLHLVHAKRQSIISPARQLLTDEALAAFERWLLEQLASICEKIMYMEFSIFRANRQSSFDRAFSSNNTEIYNEFINKMLDGGLSELLNDYPVLSSLLSSTIDLWHDSVVEFATRLQNDIEDIRNTFSGGRDTGKVTEIKAGLSDRHNGGWTVIILKFESGLKLVYKPRHLGTELAYNNLLKWINDKGIEPKLKTLKVINKSTHGWMQHVQYLPCDSEEDAKRYYLRAGVLLAVIYMLGGSDCHCQNVIACGEYPIIVDTETLMHPILKGFAQEEILDSVSGTGLLPGQWCTRDGNDYDISGLGGGIYKKKSINVLKWKNINTDNMKREYEEHVGMLAENIPFMGEEIFPPHNFIDEIVEGFRRAYNLIIKYREEIMLPKGLLQCFKGLHTRVTFRSSKAYASIISKLLEPKYLKDSAKRSSVLEIMLKDDIPTELCAIVECEKQSLYKMDIPYFTVQSDDNCLYINDLPIIKNCFIQSGFDTIKERVGGFNQVNLKQQIELIRISRLQ